MTDLSSALRVLVDDPAAPPAPIEVVFARSRRRARQRRMRTGAATFLVGLLAGTGALVAAQKDAAPSSVVLTGGDRRAAGFLATAPGGYEGTGTWRLTIVRDGRRVELSSEASPPCGDTGVIRPGDEVWGEIEGATSLLRAGERAHC